LQEKPSTFSLYQVDFVEMFVGVGASRVRDLIKPKKNRLQLFYR
jgi:ATP-dependent Zn protease